MIKVCIALGLALSVAACSPMEGGGDWSRCNSKDNAVAVSGCTAIIVAGVGASEKLALAHVTRGNAYEATGRRDKAIADFSKAILLQPGNADAYMARARARGESNKLDGAISDYARAIALRPDDAYAYNGRGYAYERKGEREQAVADYTQAIERDQDLAGAYRNRAYVYSELGRFDEAIADYDRLVALSGDADAYNARAWGYHLADRAAEGLPDAEKAVSLSPTDGNIHETRAELLEQLGRRDEAIADYRAALKLSPEKEDSVAAARAGLERLGVTP